MPKDLDPDLIRLQNELKKADLEDKHGAVFGFGESSEEFTPEMEATFLARVEEMEKGGEDSFVAIGSLVDVSELDSFETVLAAHKAGDTQHVDSAIEKALKALSAIGVITTPPDWLLPIGFYHFLLNDLLAHKVPKQGKSIGAKETVKVPSAQVIMVPYELLRQDGPAYTALVTEEFLQDLLTEGQRFSGEVLAHTCRQGADVVPKSEAIISINDWKSRWSKIEPVGFGPIDPFRADDGALYFRFGCAYNVTDHKGDRHEFDGPGICQLALEGAAYKVVGCSMEGFEM